MVEPAITQVLSFWRDEFSNSTFDTAGSTNECLILNGATHSDTEIGLYDSNGDRIADDDDGPHDPGVGPWWAQLTNINITPPFYIAVTGYDSVFNDTNFDVQAGCDSGNQPTQGTIVLRHNSKVIVPSMPWDFTNVAWFKIMREAVSAHVPDDFKTYTRANGIVAPKKYQKMGRNAVFSSSRALARVKQNRVTTSGSQAWGTTRSPATSRTGFAFGGKRLGPILRGGSFSAGPSVVRNVMLQKFSGEDYINKKKNTEFSK